MSENYTEIGIGTAKGTYKDAPTIFVVQLFGTPQAETSGAPLNTEVATPLDTPTEIATTNGAAGSVLGGETSTLDTVLDNEEGEKVLVVYSDLATTSRQGTPPIFESSGDAGVSEPVYVSALELSAVHPETWLRILYIVLAVIVCVALILSIVIEWRKQHPIQIAYAGGLLALMAVLFYVHTALTNGVTIV